MADDRHYDVIVIGTGAGGGTLGHRLYLHKTMPIGATERLR